jgi:hypothetical protein
MGSDPCRINMIAGWVGIVLAFVTGSALGMDFHRPEHLGGYASHRRRLYRLAHISLFGLAAVNLLFFLSAHQLSPSGGLLAIASWGFIAGAISMPVCCVIAAHRPDWRPLLVFAIPVLSLTVAGILTCYKVVGP